jgi:hypothetical protein
MVVSAPFKPMKVWSSTTNRNGAFAPTGASSAGTVVYSVDNGATWVNSGTATALTGASVPVVLAWRGDISDFGFPNLGMTGPIAPLPSSLTSTQSMFAGSPGLTGSFPALPAGLTNGREMFALDSGLTGSFPILPPGLVNGLGMFFKCTGATGTFPLLPSSLTNGQSMFVDCSGITGSFPALPSGLTSASNMFQGCTNAGSFPTLPSSLTSASNMFQGCTGGTYIAGTLATTRCVQFTNTFQGCALTAAMVNDMLADFRAAHNAGLINGANLRLGIGGGTNGAPTGQGLTDRTFLAGLGAFIFTN